jgi:opacity protein-like surface antigen
MKAIKLLTAMATLALPAMAQANGWYAGLDVGSARSDTEIDEYVLLGDTTDRGSSTTTGFRLHAGYQFGRFFALDLAYVDFGQSENHFDPDDCPFGAPGPCPFDVRTSIHGFIGSFVGILPIGEHWFLDARLGYGNMKVETSEIAGAGLDGNSTNAAFHYGIAGGYRFNDHWEFRLDYSGYDLDDLGLTLIGDFGAYNLGETTMTSLGVNYRW